MDRRPGSGGMGWYFTHPRQGHTPESYDGSLPSDTDVRHMGIQRRLVAEKRRTILYCMGYHLWCARQRRGSNLFPFRIDLAAILSPDPRPSCRMKTISYSSYRLYLGSKYMYMYADVHTSPLAVHTPQTGMHHTCDLIFMGGRAVETTLMRAAGP
jgi:hypothetical protein